MSVIITGCGQLLLIVVITYEFSFSGSLAEKTYEIRRLNESTFLVTSLAQRFRDRATAVAASDEAADPEPKLLETSDDINAVMDRGAAKPPKPKNVPSSLIQKARENYFRTFYATSNKPTKTKATSYAEPGPSGGGSLGRFNSHLLLARRLAANLVGEAQYEGNLMAKERFITPKAGKTRRKKRARSHGCKVSN